MSSERGDRTELTGSILGFLETVRTPGIWVVQDGKVKRMGWNWEGSAKAVAVVPWKSQWGQTEAVGRRWRSPKNDLCSEAKV